MKRAIRFLAPVVVYLAVWIALMAGLFPAISDMMDPLLLKLMPLIGLALVGHIALFNILFEVITFRRCPEAARELQEEIKQAKKELAKKGIIVPDS